MRFLAEPCWLHWLKLSEIFLFPLLALLACSHVQTVGAAKTPDA